MQRYGNGLHQVHPRVITYRMVRPSIARTRQLKRMRQIRCTDDRADARSDLAWRKHGGSTPRSSREAGGTPWPDHGCFPFLFYPFHPGFNFFTINTDFCCNQNRAYAIKIYKNQFRGFPGGAVVKNLPANAGDTGLSPGLGRSHMPRSD